MPGLTSDPTNEPPSEPTREPTPALTPVAQDYLKVVWSATEWAERPVTTKLLASRLGVGASTVSETVRRLADQGLVLAFTRFHVPAEHVPDIGIERPRRRALSQ